MSRARTQTECEQFPKALTKDCTDVPTHSTHIRSARVRAHAHTHMHKRRAVSESTRQRRYGCFYKKANPAGVAPFSEAQTTPLINSTHP